MKESDFIDYCTQKVIHGEKISLEEAEKLISISDISKLAESSNFITTNFNGERIEIESLVNAKSGNCPEDCSFCAQSSFYDTGVTKYPLLSEETIVKKALMAERQGADSFCLVCAYRAPPEHDFVKICNIIQRLKQEVKLDINVSLGFMTLERAKKLKSLGVKRYNHNLETSESNFTKICTTHDYSDRIKTAKIVKQAGLELCSGGIIGMGETPRDRLELAFALSALDPDEVPINILVAKKGTPYSEMHSITSKDIIRTIAVWRFILPRAILKLTGGREIHLSDNGKFALKAGANGIISGGYLTTDGNKPSEDIKMIQEVGRT